MPYWAPRGRRVNTPVAYGFLRCRRGLLFTIKLRTLISADVVRFLGATPVREVPCIVVLDNAGIHKSRVIQLQQALPRLRRRGIRLFYLPAYAPELNELEPVFDMINGHYLVERTYFTVESLVSSVRRAFARYRAHLNKSKQYLWPVA